MNLSLKKFNHSSSVFIPWAHNFFRKTYLANKLSYISRRVRWSSALHDRTLVGQTGNIPPISSVQPQQCHLVGFPHITQLRTDLNGSSMSPSWYFLFKKVLWSTRVTIELKANPIRLDSKHHDEPIELPFKSVRRCVICGEPTKWHCWGCTEDIGCIFPVFSMSVRPYNAELHRIRREI